MPSLLDLPVEIHNHIASYLFYHDLVRYKDAIEPDILVNPTKKQLRRILYQTELNEVDSGSLRKRACYACLSIKDAEDFNIYAICTEPERSFDRSLERVCAKCDKRAGGQFKKRMKAEFVRCKAYWTTMDDWIT